MAVFTMELAGCVIGVEAGFESTREFCREYISTKEPQIRVTVTSADLERERNMVRQQEALEELPHQVYPLPELELLALHRNIAESLFDFDTLMFHGSCVAVDGSGYLFTAKSGTGKSTHTRFWREVFGDRAVMVNDDKPFLKITPDGVTAYGSPWNGKHGLGENISAPLAGICILERGAENEIHPISPREALPMVFQQSQRPRNRANLLKYMDLVDKLAQKTAFYRMACNMDPQAAVVAYTAMSGERKEM